MQGNVALKNKFYDFQSFGAGKASFPFEQLPLLESEDGSLVLAQSSAISRFLAKKGGLIPQKDEEYVYCPIVTR